MQYPELPPLTNHMTRLKIRVDILLIKNFAFIQIYSAFNKQGNTFQGAQAVRDINGMRSTPQIKGFGYVLRRISLPL